MIIYATKETLERYKLNAPDEMHSPQMRTLVAATIKAESGDSLLEWGCKLFYFSRRKCLQLVNFASRLTIFLIDMRVKSLPYTGDAVAKYLFEIYKEKIEMKPLIEKYFEDSFVACFDKLRNKSIISVLNHTQTFWTNDGYAFYDYIKNGILNTKQINKDINRNWLFTKNADGRKVYFFSADEFERLLKARYSSAAIDNINQFPKL